MDAFILKPQFIDRAGRTAYAMIRIDFRPNPENPQEQQMTEGPAVGMVRFADDCVEAPIEWFQDVPRAEPGPPRAEVPPVPGFVPGDVEGDGTG